MSLLLNFNRRHVRPICLLNKLRIDSTETQVTRIGIYKLPKAYKSPLFCTLIAGWRLLWLVPLLHSYQEYNYVLEPFVGLSWNRMLDPLRDQGTLLVRTTILSLIAVISAWKTLQWSGKRNAILVSDLAEKTPPPTRLSSLDPSV